MTIFLCGFMGCGKSTIGKRLAEFLGVTFTDMDAYIEKEAQMTIPEIFAQKGEKVFREMETDAIRRLAERSGVIACGGGAMLKEENSEIANANGIVVYIDVSFEECYSRISGDTNRPIVMNNTKEQLEEIYNSRIALYEAHSKIKINGENPPDQTAKLIKDEIRIY